MHISHCDKRPPRRSNLLAGKSGISQIERWDPHKYELTTTIAGEIKGARPARRATTHAPAALA
jgi:hypothetical protein